MVNKIILHSRVLMLLTTEIIFGVVSSLATVLIFLKIFQEVLESDTLLFDQQISALIYNWRSPELTKIMLFITNFGASYMLITAVLIVILFVWKKHKMEALAFGVILIIGLILNVSLKEVARRQRPMLAPLVIEKSYSFPSGHAMNSSVFYLAVAFYTYHFTRKKKVSLGVTIGAMMMILLIGFSRVYLGVHYPSDVIAGYVVGLWWLVTAILISKSFSWVKHFRLEEKKAVY